MSLKHSSSVSNGCLSNTLLLSLRHSFHSCPSVSNTPLILSLKCLPPTYPFFLSSSWFQILNSLSTHFSLSFCLCISLWLHQSLLRPLFKITPTCSSVLSDSSFHSDRRSRQQLGCKIRAHFDDSCKLGVILVLWFGFDVIWVWF